MNVILKIACTTIFLSISTIFAIAQSAEEIFQRGNSLDWEGNYREALVHVDNSLKIDSSLYQRYHFRADLKVKLGMIESAIDDITKCIHKCNCSTRMFHVAKYYLDRAELQLLNKNISAALADVNKSISVNSNNWKAYNFRSSLLFKSGNFQDALMDLDKSIKLNDNEASTFISRGKLRIEMGDTEGACDDISKVSNWGIDDFDSWLNENCK
jgi:tetratricopeptide (TPR) repeat protein